MQPLTSIGVDAVIPVARIGPEAPSRFVDTLLGSHGEALFGLAMLILADRDRAATVAEQAIWDAYKGPLDVARPANRRELARYVYVRCVRQLESPPMTPGVRDAARDDPQPTTIFTSLSYDQRAAIGLCVFGQHTYADSADLTGLTRTEVADLLRSGLHIV